MMLVCRATDMSVGFRVLGVLHILDVCRGSKIVVLPTFCFTSTLSFFTTSCVSLSILLDRKVTSHHSQLSSDYHTS